jgi:hypothetical protein
LIARLIRIPIEQQDALMPRRELGDRVDGWGSGWVEEWMGGGVDWEKR